MQSRFAEVSASAHLAARPPEPPFTLRTGLKRWVCDSRARQGLGRTLRQLMRETFDFLRDSMPSRRRQRWGDIDFDCDFHVDTTAARLDARTRLLGALLGGAYQPSEPQLFHRMLDALPIDFREFAFIDLGSGKGRALLMASDYPFRRILGVELLPELHRIALENIAKYRNPPQKCFAIESCCGDALDFEFPPEPMVLYIFNPFPETGLAKAIGKLEDSIARNPRPVYVVYHNPMLEHVLDASSALRRIVVNIQFAIYTNS
jgi:SAM-dependent methyltransferase